MALCCLLLFFFRSYKSRNFWDCVYKFLQCLIIHYVFPIYNSFDLCFSFNVFCDSFFIVDPSFCFIGSLPPSNSLFDIIVDPRWIVDGGSSFRLCQLCQSSLSSSASKKFSKFFGHAQSPNLYNLHLYNLQNYITSHRELLITSAQFLAQYTVLTYQ